MQSFPIFFVAILGLFIEDKVTEFYCLLDTICCSFCFLLLLHWGNYSHKRKKSKNELLTYTLKST